MQKSLVWRRALSFNPANFPSKAYVLDRANTRRLLSEGKRAERDAIYEIRHLCYRG